MENFIQYLQNNKYFGVDHGLDISLFEYSFVIKQISENEYHFFNCFIARDNNQYIQSGSVYIDDLTDLYLDESDNINAICDISDISEFMDLPVQHKISSLQSVYTYMDIFGTPGFGAESIDIFLESYK